MRPRGAIRIFQQKIAVAMKETDQITVGNKSKMGLRRLLVMINVWLSSSIFDSANLSLTPATKMFLAAIFLSPTRAKILKNRRGSVSLPLKNIYIADLHKFEDTAASNMI